VIHTNINQHAIPPASLFLMSSFRNPLRQQTSSHNPNRRPAPAPLRIGHQGPAKLGGGAAGFPGIDEDPRVFSGLRRYRNASALHNGSTAEVALGPCRYRALRWMSPRWPANKRRVGTGCSISAA